MGAIGLNPIRLDRIGLDPIRVNAIRLGVPGAASGSDRPYIDPEVLASLKAVCICYGKSNDDPDRAIVKNLVDPDNPFIISNAAYTEGSGYADKDSPYYGAFVTDGIDDLITSTKTVQEMLGGSNECTVVSMIHQISSNNSNICRNNFICNKGLFWHSNNVINTGKTGIYGYTSTNNSTSVINNILGDKNDYSVVGDKNDITPSQFSVVGYVGGSTGEISYTSSVAWYWTIISNKVLTTDQINQVIAYYNLDRCVEPTVWYDVQKQGLTNETPAADWYLKDFSKNGFNMSLFNFAKDGDSGIGKCNYPNWKINVTQGNKYARIVYYDSINGTYSANFKGVTGFYKSYGLSIEIRVNRVNTVDFHSIKEDGIYTVTPPDDTTSIDIRFGGENVYNASCDITITQIPSHAGALCFDGVDDFGKVTGLPIFKDYTVVINKEVIASNTSCVLSKAATSAVGAFIMEFATATYSFGSQNAFTTGRSGITYQSKYSYNGERTLTVGTNEDADSMWLGTVRDNDSRFFNGAVYSLMSFPYSMSEFLIERQLKKRKAGTLYPDMVEFRPKIKSDERIKSINYYIGLVGATVGQYYPIGSGLGIAVETVDPYVVNSLKVNGVLAIPNADHKGFNSTLDSKSPQNITMDIGVDSTLVQWNPTVQSNIAYKSITYRRIDVNPWETINIGDYLPIGTRMQILLGLYDSLDEISSVDSDQLNNISINGNEITCTLTSGSPQKIDITIDEYIRYEDIVQPYPVLLRFNDESGNEVSWGGKFRVGSTVTRIGSIADAENNLLNGLYSVSGLSLNGKAVTTSTSVVEKQMVFKTTATYLLGSNKPKCVLSPSRLNIPNSSYKILGYIPDLSGNENHGIINNSAYAEGSGVNADGSYQLDGVDDFITIPTTVGGKQVLMKVNWQSAVNTAIIYDQRTSGGFAILNGDTTADGVSVPAYEGRNVGGSTYIDGILNEHIYASQLKDITHNITAIYNPSNGVGVLNPRIGFSYLNSSYSQMSLYDFMLFDEISTDEEILTLNKYVGIEPKVTVPPYYWDTYGKTNNDADDIEGNHTRLNNKVDNSTSYQLVPYNFSWDLMSGYGGYIFGKFDNTDEWISVDNESISVVARNGYSVTLRKGTGVRYWWFRTILAQTSEKLSFKVKADSNITVMFDFHYYVAGDETEHNTNRNTVKLQANTESSITLNYLTQEELTELNVDLSKSYYILFFNLDNLAEGEETTIEMLPLYPNGLCLDGVDDYLFNANIPAFTDYTYVLKRELLDLDKAGGNASMYKGSFVPAGGRAFIADYYINSGVGTDGAYGFSFGSSIKSPTLLTDKTVYGTKTSVNGVSITPGSATDDASLTLGKWDANYKQMVFYKLMLYPKTLTNLEIMFLKNMFEKDEIIDLTNPIFIQE